MKKYRHVPLDSTTCDKNFFPSFPYVQFIYIVYYVMYGYFWLFSYEVPSGGLQTINYET